MEQLSTIAEVAEVLGVSKQRVQALLARGRIKGARRFADVWAIPVNEQGRPDITPGKAGRPKRPS